MTKPLFFFKLNRKDGFMLESKTYRPTDSEANCTGSISVEESAVLDALSTPIIEMRQRATKLLAALRLLPRKLTHGQAEVCERFINRIVNDAAARSATIAEIRERQRQQGTSTGKTTTSQADQTRPEPITGSDVWDFAQNILGPSQSNAEQRTFLHLVQDIQHHLGLFRLEMQSVGEMDFDRSVE